MDSFKKWNPKQYLKQYYNLQNLVYDEIVIVKFIIEFLREQNRMFKSMLDFGAGPTIHRIIPFAPYVNEIYIADYLSSNLKEINFWLKSSKSSHNWFNQIRHILEIEGDQNGHVVNRDYIESRIQLLRNKKPALIKCNIFKKQPLSIKKKFPLVTSFYCADSVTETKKDWEKAMVNLLSLVEPGGCILLTALRQTTKYKVGNNYFPSPNLHEKDFIDILTKNGFNRDMLRIEVISAKIWNDEGIESLLALSAVKKL